ncbi:MAG: transglycosylase SLT domain-containing protein, partial [Legionellaceae bacterium]
MIKQVVFVFFYLCFSLKLSATPEQTLYLQRFTAYSAWNEQLPTTPSQDFLNFIQEKKPLSNKLREKWLYALASKENWPMYLAYYQPSNDSSLQCYALYAQYQENQQAIAILGAKKQWLTGESKPPACDKLFLLLFKDRVFDGSLVTQRIALALEQRNFSLASYLLKKYKQDEPNNDQVLSAIHKNPSSIVKLIHNELQGDFYTYGLNHMLAQNMDRATTLWKTIKQKNILNEHQQQSFLSSLALYKAIRDKPDAPAWFAQVKSAFYSPALLEWQIRYALKHRQWKRMIPLIQHLSDKDAPCWQYWLARAEDQTNQHESAQARYQTLATMRNYYGFMASMRIKKPFQFQDASIPYHRETLRPYDPILNKIKTLYQNKQQLEASRLVSDFSSELSQDEKSNVATWVGRELDWTGKSVYLSQAPELNNDLTLRFPLAHEGSIRQQARTYHLPEALIYAVIRQESAFREEVVSGAGAHGLMQLMPNTAKLVAQQHKIAYTDKKQLFVTQKNIHLGTAYLHQLGNRFGQHPLLMAAAYNAGPR